MTSDLQPGPESPVLFKKSTMTVILGIVVVLIAILAFAFLQAGQGTTVPAATCGAKTMTYVNTNLLQQGTVAELRSTTEKNGLYEMQILVRPTGDSDEGSVQGVIYVTKDCTRLFTNPPIEMTSGSAQGASFTPVKSVRPVVDLYVMSLCPYGIQAETAMGPVTDLLGSKADIRLRYIATVSGTTIESVDSMHGSAEAEEDLRQLCIANQSPDKIWSYIAAFNEQCYPSMGSTTALASCRRSIERNLTLDSKAINSCAQGDQGLAMMRADEAASAENSAYSSPTLIINGVWYNGARTPEAYKQAICSSFETVPAECSTVLSSSSTAATGQC